MPLIYTNILWCIVFEAKYWYFALSNKFVISKYVVYSINFNPLGENLCSILIYAYLILYNFFFDYLLKAIYINFILYILSENYSLFESLLYIYNSSLALLVLFLLFIHINFISVPFKEKHPLVTLFLSIIIIALFLFLLYNILTYILDLHYIIKQHIIHMNPRGVGPNNNPDSGPSSSNNPGNNPGNNPKKDPGSGSGVGFKQAEEDKKGKEKKNPFDLSSLDALLNKNKRLLEESKKSISIAKDEIAQEEDKKGKEKKSSFDFSSLDALLNKNKVLYEESKKSVSTVVNERLTEENEKLTSELKENVNSAFNNYLEIYKIQQEHTDKTSYAYSSKNRSQAKSIFHKIRTDEEKYESLKDDFLKSLDDRTDLPRITDFLKEQREHLLRAGRLVADLEEVSTTAMEKDVKNKGMTSHEFNLYTLVRADLFGEIDKLAQANTKIVDSCSSIYSKLEENKKTK